MVDELAPVCTRKFFEEFNVQIAEFNSQTPYVDPDSLKKRVDILSQIDPGNETAIATLVELIQSDATNEDLLLVVAECLGKMAFGNQRAITFLSQWVQSKEIDKDSRLIAALSLGKIDPVNGTAITALVELIHTALDEYLNSLRALLNRSDEISEADLLELYRLGRHCYLAAKGLGETDPGNQTAITALVELLNPSLDQFILNARCYVAESLWKIDPGNEIAITTLVELIESAEDEDTRSEVVCILGEIGTGNEKAINVLVELIQNECYEDHIVAESLGKIDPGNEMAINTLLELILNGWDEDEVAANSLKSILQGNQFPKVVTVLKHYMAEQVYEDNFFFYSACHDVIWRCAQNMSYPEFYQAWRSEPSTRYHTP